jgi:hypothetical protein
MPVLLDPQFKRVQAEYKQTIDEQDDSVASDRIIGVHCYDILANIDYMRRFQYIPNNAKNRYELINCAEGNTKRERNAQNDLPRLILNFGFQFHEDNKKVLISESAVEQTGLV